MHHASSNAFLCVLNVSAVTLNDSMLPACATFVPGRCGFQPHRIGTVENSAYQTASEPMN